MKRIGQLVFVGAVAVALVLYWLTAPDGLPWNRSMHLALAYLGEIVRLPVMLHPVWGCYVQVFGGAVALSVVMAALAAGMIAILVNRYFGWRFAASAALVWIFLPGVWNRAITGERVICLAAMAIVAAWVLDGVGRRVWSKVREMLYAYRGGAKVLPSAGGNAKRERVNRIAGWVAMGAAGLFAVVSLTFHDYRYGEAASVFARGVVEEAGERVIVLNGVCDDQIVDAASRTTLATSLREATCGRWICVGKDGLSSFQTRQDAASTVALRNDDAYRTNLLGWVRSAFPTETNLWVAAQVGAAAFVEVASRKHPDRFYLMGGESTTLEGWEKRWEAFKPYLKSRDPFVRVARRAFGYEGNAVANAIVDATSSSRRNKDGLSSFQTRQDAASTVQTRQDAASTAYALYKRIYTEIDPGNLSALVNMSEMVRLGYAVSGDERKKLQENLEKFFKDAFNRKHAREIARAAGPIRADPALLEKMSAEAKKRIAAKIAAGEKVECSPEVLSLVEWNNEMVRLMAKGELVQAGRIARAILSNPKWQGFVPANAVMGSVSAREGDYVSSAAFFKAATDTTNTIPVAVLNDYADTLIHLRRIEEAEKLARRAVKESEEPFWVARLTLAEVLEKKVMTGGQGQERKVDEAVLEAFAVDVDAASRRVRRDEESSSLTRQDAASTALTRQDAASTALTRQDAASTGADSEIRALLKSVLKHAPAKVCDGIRKEHWKYVR